MAKNKDKADPYAGFGRSTASPESETLPDGPSEPVGPQKPTETIPEDQATPLPAQVPWRYKPNTTPGQIAALEAMERILAGNLLRDMAYNARDQLGAAVDVLKAEILA